MRERWTVLAPEGPPKMLQVVLDKCGASSPSGAGDCASGAGGQDDQD